jgi:hypothetical protein
MKISIKGFITHKAEEQYSDCADRYAFNKDNNRFAIADGVSRSFFPAQWAESLVDKFVGDKEGIKGIKDIKDIIPACQGEWLRQVKEIAQKPDAKWFTKNQFAKNEAGLATFVSLYFDKENTKWNASALGDSFLFFVPKDKLKFDDWVRLSSKPEPVVFDSYPDYFSSRGQAHGEVKHIEEDLKEGTFYLMTDALSEWVFKEKGDSLKKIKEEWINQVEFERSVNELRQSDKLNNDDSAVLIIELQNDKSPDFHYKPVEVQDIKDLIEREKNEIEQEQRKREASVSESTENQLNQDKLIDEPIKLENKEIHGKKFSKKECKAIKCFNTVKLTNQLKKMEKKNTENVLKEIREKLKKIFEDHGIPFED